MSLSRVVIVRAPGVLSADGVVRGPALVRLYEKGLRLLTGASEARDALASIFRRPNASASRSTPLPDGG